MQSCLDLSRSVEHQVFRTLSNCATRRGIISNGVDEICKITGLPNREAAEAVETLVDGELVEALGEGAYRVFQLCKCPPENLFESRPKTGGAGRSMLVPREPTTAPDRSVDSHPLPPQRHLLRLSRSLPKNENAQDWREKSPSGQLSYLVGHFKGLCRDFGISPRGFNGPALYSHLKRWQNDGVDTLVIHEMMRCFAGGTHPRDFERRGTVAWQLFVSRRAALEQKAKDNLVWELKAQQPSNALEKYRAERERELTRRRQMAPAS